jgi:hypothetical protein
MPLIEEIQDKVEAGLIEFSEHATERSIRRNISVHDVLHAIADGVVIEDYPEDKYGPSCLIFGRDRKGRPLHVQVSYPSRPLVKVITLYEPDPALWINYRFRRQP